MLALAVVSWRALLRARHEIAVATGAGVLLLLVTSAEPYWHNTVAHGHPFYPINVVDIMYDQMPDAFLRLGRFHRGYLTYFADRPMGSSRTLPHASLGVPHRSDYRALIVDTRVQGFGPLFAWALLLSGPVAAAALWRLRANGAAFALLLAWAVVSTVVNPDFWWARFVPQFWFVPVLAAAAAFAARWRIAGLLILATALMGSALTFAYWARATAAGQRDVRQTLARIAGRSDVALLKGWNANDGAFTFAYLVREIGVDVTLVSGPNSSCRTDVGNVRLCEPPQ